MHGNRHSVRQQANQTGLANTILPRTKITTTTGKSRLMTALSLVVLSRYPALQPPRMAGRDKNNNKKHGDIMRINTSRLAAVSVGLVLTVQSAMASEQALPKQFGAIKEFLLDTVAESQHHGAAATYGLLHQNLAEFQRLKIMVEQAPHIDDVIDELSSGLATIAGNFEQAAAMRGVYKTQTDNSDRELHHKRLQTRQAIEAINNRIATVDTELKQAQQALPTARSDTDRERHQITISANLSVLHSLNAQVEIWRRFEDTQKRLASSLQQSASRTDFLLFVLEKNAQVYREAANTAQLRQDAHLALSNLEALGGIESSLTDLAASWRAVDQLVNEIGSEAFRYDVSS